MESWEWSGTRLVSGAVYTETLTFSAVGIEVGRRGMTGNRYCRGYRRATIVSTHSETNATSWE